MTGRAKRLLLCVTGTVAVLVVAVILLRTTGAKPKAIPSMPVPNGYDSFVQAGALAALPDTDITKLSHEALRALIQTNTDALNLFRTGLTQACVVPPGYCWTNVSKLMEFKQLAQLLIAEGHLAELENRPNDAARCYADCIRFGNEQGRGGPLMHWLVGIACENIGYQPLLRALPTLPPEGLRQLARQVDDSRRKRVSFESALRAERAWIAQMSGSASLSFQRLLAWPQNRKTSLLGEQKDLRSLTRLTLLPVELSLRCYRAEHGNPPAELEELTPAFLKEIPLDPFSGKPLIYRPQGTHWLLYSVGPDRVDDGGVPALRRSSKQVSVGPPFFSINVPAGDVFYDSTW